MKHNKPTLTVFCGLPGAGKTTIARQVEEQTGAIRLNTDDWMADLKLDFFDAPERNLLQNKLIDHGWNILGQGADVILEDGQWTKEERDEKVDRAITLGARVVIYVFDLSLEELWLRLKNRNNNLSHGTVPVTRELLDSYVMLFQVRKPNELKEYDKVYVFTDRTTLKLA